jgi:hypothetical protein
VSVIFLDHRGGGIDPSSTTRRHVSGINRSSGTYTADEKISWNQNRKCHPAYCAMAPPRTGAIIGPKMPASEAYAMYVPRSAEVTMSPTTPLARETVDEEPALWIMRRMSRAV